MTSSTPKSLLKMPPPDLNILILTLSSAGFAIERVDRRPGYCFVLTSRRDEFGLCPKTGFAVSECGQFSAEQVSAVTDATKYLGGQLVLVGECTTNQVAMDWQTFLTLLGGAVSDSHPLDSGFGVHLETLGFNELPSDLTGKADTLFEIYVRNALQFLLGVTVIRYGQDRLFEARPDGIVLPNNSFSALYDAKAYSSGYPVEADSVRQFGSYVREFQKRYSAQLVRLNSFIVVSGAFQQGSDALQSRSDELIADCGVPISFLTARALREMIEHVAKSPWARSSVIWSKLFSKAIPSSRFVSDELDAIRKDKVSRHH